ncbi:MAG: hypothetical protein ACREIA_19375, partial [Opitutaceae bacterium]
MNYKYSLPDSLVNEVAKLRDFANGGTQISVKTKDGKVYHEIVVSAGRHVVAMRGYDNLPFSIDQIAEVFQ